MKNKKKILILGATGFIGRNCLIHFSKKNDYSTYGTYNKKKPFYCKNVKWIKVDLLNKSQIDKVIKKKDVVIQAAATTSGSKDIVNTPQLHVTDNAIMNSLIMRSAFEQNVRNVIFFSCTVMYPNSKKKYLSEKDIKNKNLVTTKYFGAGNTKLYIEKICEFFGNLGETKYTCVRHSNIYGPYDKFDLNKGHFFAANMLKVFNHKNKKLSIWGKGTEMRDLLHIKDLLSFIDLILIKQKAGFKIYNCTYGKSFKVIEIIKKIIKFSKKNIFISCDLSQPTIPINILVNSKKAKKEIGWYPKVNIDEGIKETFKWMKKNL
tara:strand:- start:4094 stop:5050 length:957 start_codon:yes stop_codon:yes gene_type:complete